MIIDPEKAKGHAEIVDTCPYGSIYWNEEAQAPQKCTGCAHLLDAGWTETRCSQICPTGAIRLVLADDDEMAALAAAEGLEAYRADLGTKPRVLYRNLYRWNKSFIAANVAYDDTDECAEGARVTVTSGGTKAGEESANNYGEFLVDGLEPGFEYDVVVEAAGYKPYSAKVQLAESISLGLILLESAIDRERKGVAAARPNRWRHRILGQHKRGVEHEEALVLESADRRSPGAARAGCVRND